MLDGIHHVKFPVRDLAAAREWWERVLSLTPQIEFRDDSDGVVRGVAYEPTGGVMVSLRERPDVAAGVNGFDFVALGVPTHAELEKWVAHFDELGVEHSPIIEATVGWLLTVDSPDRGVQLRFYTWERP